MGRLRRHLRRLTREAEREMLSFELEDGTRVCFPPSAFLECLAHEWKCGRALRSGKEVSRDEHPLMTALKQAKPPQRLLDEGYGTLLMTDAESERSLLMRG